MTRRFLVTGGAGYVGSHLVAALRDRGDQVVVLDNFNTGHRGSVPPDVPLIEADLGDTARLDAVLSDGPWTSVFHFASVTQVGESMRMPMRYLLENAANTMKLIDGCVRHGVDRFVMSSTAALFNATDDRPIPEDAPVDPQSAYGDSKWMIERALRWAFVAHGLRSARLRYFNAAGADPAGRLGEDHRPESHPDPSGHRRRPRPPPAAGGLRRRLSDRGRHLHPRLCPRHRSGRGAPAGAVPPRHGNRRDLESRLRDGPFGHGRDPRGRADLRPSGAIPDGATAARRRGGPGGRVGPGQGGRLASSI